MNIREALLEEHSKILATRIAEYATSSKKRFAELMQCYQENEYRIAQRAAWSVCWAALAKPALIIPYIDLLIEKMKSKQVHPALVRNAVRILEVIDIPEKYHGDVMHTCFGFIEDPHAPIAVKAFSLTILFNLSKKYPDIGSELKLIIEERWQNETAAFRSRGKKILKQLN